MKFDVFICHASEDKQEFVADLADGLRSRNVNVWYDDFALKVGDKLSQSISKGLTESTFGIVVMSPNFFSKNWTQMELSALITREEEYNKVILPVWHNISKRDVLKYCPLLADRVAARSEMGMSAVIEDIYKVLEPTLQYRNLADQSVGMMTIMVGKVRFFNSRKGYGFIDSEDDYQEFFVHQSALEENSLDDGDRVAFLARKNDRGGAALGVRRI